MPWVFAVALSVLDFAASEGSSTMKIHFRVKIAQHEERVEEIRSERMSEAKHIERLISVLVQKTTSRKSNGLAVGCLACRVLTLPLRRLRAAPSAGRPSKSRRKPSRDVRSAGEPS
jgi:hypothetical protein